MKSFQQILTTKPMKEADHSRHPLIAHIASRPHGVYHFGVWCTRNGDISVPRECLNSDLNYKASVQFVCSPGIEKLNWIAGEGLRAVDTEWWKLATDAFKKMKPEQGGNFWAGCRGQTVNAMNALVANEFVVRHHDRKDAKRGWCIIMVFGKFTGGFFCLPDLGIKIPFEAGDVIYVRSYSLEHFVAEWDGDCRFSFLGFTHEKVFNQ